MQTKGATAFWRTGGGLAALGLLLVVLVAANFIVGRARWRTDLTAEKLYTLSDGTRQILQKLDKPVTLKLFFSRSAAEVPVNIKAYASQVEDLLHEYRTAGGRNLMVEIVDPKPDSEAEELAQGYGVTPQNVDPMGAGQPTYFGLVAICGESEGSIAALDPRTDNLLEYNLTRLIYRVTHPQKPVVGVLSSLPVMGDAQDAQSFGMPPQRQSKPWLAFQEIQDDYDLRRLDASVDAIPEDIHALVVVHPKELPDKTLYALDQFVLRGGHLLAFLDPMNVADLESAGQNPYGRPQASSTLGPLLTAWGIGFDPASVLADVKATSRLRADNNRVEESPVFLTLHKDNVSQKDITTAQLSMLMMPFAGTFQDQTQGKLTVTPLITSSDLSGMIPAMTAQFGAAAINRDFKPEAKVKSLAIRVAGTFRTAFPNGKPAEKTEDKDEEAKAKPATPQAPALKEGKSTVILVGDADMIYDRFCVEELNFFGAKALQPLNDNVSFFANCVEQMAGSSDLIGIRSRGEFFRPFDRVEALEQKARQAWHDKEQDLTTKLQETREQLSKLQNQKDAGQKFILSTEQKEAIAHYKQTELQITRDLKGVRKNLRQEIETLGVKVKVANIVLMPVLISLGGVAYGLRRRRQR